MKKRIVSGLIGILSSVLFVLPVSAHGHHSRQTDYESRQNYLCEVCVQEDCTKSGWHVHDGITYCGYDHEEEYCDGTCNVVAVCTVEKCTEEGHHIHDDQSYCGYDHESGYCDGTCGSVAVCSDEGCTKTGLHLHSGVSYCGYDHASGYCDGSCEKVKGTNTKGQGRHHERHCV